MEKQRNWKKSNVVMCAVMLAICALLCLLPEQYENASTHIPRERVRIDYLGAVLLTVGFFSGSVMSSLKRFAIVAPPGAGAVVADGPDVEIRCRPRQDGTLIGARLKRRAESDLKFRFILGRGNERLTKEVTFANGLRPADSVETGTAFFVLLPPLEGGFPEQVQAEVLPL